MSKFRHLPLHSRQQVFEMQVRKEFQTPLFIFVHEFPQVLQLRTLCNIKRLGKSEGPMHCTLLFVPVRTSDPRLPPENEACSSRFFNIGRPVGPRSKPVSSFILFLRGAFAGLSLSFSFVDLSLSLTCFYYAMGHGKRVRCGSFYSC